MKHKKILLTCLYTLSALLFWGLIWHFAAQSMELPLILPTPAEVFGRLWELMGTSDFYLTLLLSFSRVFAGFLLGAVVGFLLGVAAHFLPLVHHLFSPFMALVRATPVASFILVVVLLLERDGVPVFISFLMVLPMVWQNTRLGFERRDVKLSEMAKVYHFGPVKTFLHVDLPQVTPHVLAALRTCLGLAWKAGVAAEVLSLPKASVGTMIYNAKLYLETADLYAWTLSIILFSVILEKALVQLIRPRRKRPC